MIRGRARTPGGHGATVPRQGRGVPGPGLRRNQWVRPSRRGRLPIPRAWGMHRGRPGPQRRPAPHPLTPVVAGPNCQPSAPRAPGAAGPSQDVRTTLVWGRPFDSRGPAPPRQTLECASSRRGGQGPQSSAQTGSANWHRLKRPGAPTRRRKPPSSVRRACAHWQVPCRRAGDQLSRRPPQFGRAQPSTHGGEAPLPNLGRSGSVRGPPVAVMPLTDLVRRLTGPCAGRLRSGQAQQPCKLARCASSSTAFLSSALVKVSCLRSASYEARSRGVTHLALAPEPPSRCQPGSCWHLDSARATV